MLNKSIHILLNSRIHYKMLNLHEVFKIGFQAAIYIYILIYVCRLLNSIKYHGLKLKDEGFRKK